MMVNIFFCYSSFYLSDPFKRDFHRWVHNFVVFRDWLDVRVPPILLANLPQPLLIDGCHVLWLDAKSCRVRVVGRAHRVWSKLSTVLRESDWSSSQILPFLLWLSQERNRIRILLCFLNFVNAFPSVRNVSVEDEWSCIHWGLELTLCRSHRWAILWSVLHAQCLNFFPGNRICRCVLSEELWIGHCWIIKGYVVVHGAIEVLSVCAMACVVIFGTLYVKVRDPAELSIDISVFWNPRVVWHPCALDFVQFVRIMLSFWFN